MKMCRKAPPINKQALLPTRQDSSPRRLKPVTRRGRRVSTSTSTTPSAGTAYRGAVDTTLLPQALEQPRDVAEDAMPSLNSAANIESAREFSVASTRANPGGCPSNLDDERVGCINCGRKFSPDRVNVHEEICKRVYKNDGRGRRGLKERRELEVQRTRGSSCPVFGGDAERRIRPRLRRFSMVEQKNGKSDWHAIGTIMGEITVTNQVERNPSIVARGSCALVFQGRSLIGMPISPTLTACTHTTSSLAI